MGVQESGDLTRGADLSGVVVWDVGVQESGDLTRGADLSGVVVWDVGVQVDGDLTRRENDGVRRRAFSGQLRRVLDDVHFNRQL